MSSFKEWLRMILQTDDQPKSALRRRPLTPRATDETREFDAGVRKVCNVQDAPSYMREHAPDDFPERYFCEHREQGRILVYGEGTCHGDVVRVDATETHLRVWHTRSSHPIDIERPVLYLADSLDKVAGRLGEEHA